MDKAAAARIDLEELMGYDTATICNAIDLFEVRPPDTGYMDYRIRCCFEYLRPMVGYATTFTFQASGPPPAGSSEPEVADVLDTFDDLPGPPIVVIQDLDEPAVGASFGDLSCNSYKAFGAAGLITSGAGRDWEHVEPVGLPVFVGASSICSHGYSRVTTIGRPVQVGGLTIRPGDLLHGDGNGVVVIPHEIAPAVAQTAGEVMEIEKSLLMYVTGTSKPTTADFRNVAAEMGVRFAEITKRLTADRERN